jgi:hypothetical protein
MESSAIMRSNDSLDCFACESSRIVLTDVFTSDLSFREQLRPQRPLWRFSLVLQAERALGHTLSAYSSLYASLPLSTSLRIRASAKLMRISTEHMSLANIWRLWE